MEALLFVLALGTVVKYKENKKVSKYWKNEYRALVSTPEDKKSIADNEKFKKDLDAFADTLAPLLEDIFGAPIKRKEVLDEKSNI